MAVTQRESDHVFQAERDIAVRKAAVDIVRMLQGFTCEERQAVERRVKELIAS